MEGFDTELEDANDTEPNWTSVALNAQRYTLFTEATPEAQQDLVGGVENSITSLFREAFNAAVDYHVLNGGNSFTGIIDHAATYSQTRNTANTIKFVDVVNMESRMATDGGNWKWIVSRASAYAQLLNLEDSQGNAVLQPNAREGAVGQMFGKEILRSQYAATLGSSGDLLLVNLNSYAFGTRMEPEISFSDDYNFRKSYRSWKLVARIAGIPLHASTLALNGGDVVAEAIQLDAATS